MPPLLCRLSFLGHPVYCLLPGPLTGLCPSTGLQTTWFLGPAPLQTCSVTLAKLLHLSELICNMRVLDPKTSDFPSGSQFGDSVDTWWNGTHLLEFRKCSQGLVWCYFVSAKCLANLDAGCHGDATFSHAASRSKITQGCTWLSPGRKSKSSSICALGKPAVDGDRRNLHRALCRWGWLPEAQEANCRNKFKWQPVVFLRQVKGLMDGNQGCGAEMELKGRGLWEAVRSQSHMLLGFWTLAWGAAFEQSLKTGSQRGARGRYKRTAAWTGRGDTKQIPSWARRAALSRHPAPDPAPRQASGWEGEYVSCSSCPDIFSLVPPTRLFPMKGFWQSWSST